MSEIIFTSTFIHNFKHNKTKYQHFQLCNICDAVSDSYVQHVYDNNNNDDDHDGVHSCQLGMYVDCCVLPPCHLLTCLLSSLLLPSFLGVHRWASALSFRLPDSSLCQTEGAVVQSDHLVVQKCRPSAAGSGLAGQCVCVCVCVGVGVPPICTTRVSSVQPVWYFVY